MGYAEMMGTQGDGVPQQVAMAPVVQPQTSGLPAEGPPATPEEQQARVGGWMEWFDKLKTDPAMQQTMLHVGGQLLQGAGQGESIGNLAGRALESGQQYLGFARQNEQAAALAEKDQAGKALVQQSTIASNEANIRQSDASASNSTAQAATTNYKLGLDKWLTKNMSTMEKKLYVLGSSEFAKLATETEAAYNAMDTLPGDEDKNRKLALGKVLKSREKVTKDSGNAIRVQAINAKLSAGEKLNDADMTVLNEIRDAGKTSAATREIPTPATIELMKTKMNDAAAKTEFIRRFGAEALPK